MHARAASRCKHYWVVDSVLWGTFGAPQKCSAPFPASIIRSLHPHDATLAAPFCWVGCWFISRGSPHWVARVAVLTHDVGVRSNPQVVGKASNASAAADADRRCCCHDARIGQHQVHRALCMRLVVNKAEPGITEHQGSRSWERCTLGLQQLLVVAVLLDACTWETLAAVLVHVMCLWHWMVCDPTCS